MPSDDPARRLRDMLGEIGRIRRHTAGMTAAEFRASEIARDAVERCLQRVTEAARKIGDVLDERYPEAELHKLRRFGSVLRHDYDRADPDRIWLFVEERLDVLEGLCRRELGTGGR